MDGFKFGNVSVPDGARGPWRIETFSISKSAAELENMRAAFGGRRYAMTRPGEYKRLVHERRGVVMSNTPMEVRQASGCYHAASGSVLVNGLGLGMVVEGLLTKPEVTNLTVVEIDPDVIELVAPHFAADRRFHVINADAYEFKPAKGLKFDYVWHDIWDEITSGNLPLMARLTRKYARCASKQGVWARDEARDAARRDRHW